MKVIAVNGITHTGKTTVCETIIQGLRKKGYTVGSVKEIHYEAFEIDPSETSNTHRHRKAGSQLVIARGLKETDVLYPEKLPINELLSFFDQDYVILEGVTDCNAPRILTAHNTQELEERVDDRVIAVSGVIANDPSFTEWEGRKVFHAMNQQQALVDFVEENAACPIPAIDPDCCKECGHTCLEFAGLAAQKKVKLSDCVMMQPQVSLTVNNKQIKMVPFVQKLLRNAVMAVAGELDGVKQQGDITVSFHYDGKL